MYLLYIVDCATYVFLFVYLGPVAHSTPSKSSAKTLRFSDKYVGAEGGVDSTDGASLPPTRFVFRRDLSSSLNNEQQSNVCRGQMSVDVKCV